MLCFLTGLKHKWRKKRIMSCKHHMVSEYSKHCINCGKSLVDIDKEIKEKKENEKEN